MIATRRHQKRPVAAQKSFAKTALIVENSFGLKITLHAVSSRVSGHTAMKGCLWRRGLRPLVAGVSVHHREFNGIAFIGVIQAAGFEADFGEAGTFNNFRELAVLQARHFQGDLVGDGT